jgi:uncharacterized membrane protein YfcA
MTIVQVLLGTLVASGVLFVARLLFGNAASPAGKGISPTPLGIAIGLVTNFFDTLGIGSFATTTAVFRLFGVVADELIPGTLIVGHALPVLTQALVFISVVSVDPAQMGWLIGVCVIGGWLGAGVVASLSRRAVQIGMGCALLAAASFMVLGTYGLFPAGGPALSFSRSAFLVAVAVNFALGALLTLGIGNYAPSLIAFSLLGIDPRAAFPIMMGSGAFVATIAGIRFVGTGRFHARAALGLTLGGIPGVLAAVWLVKSLPLLTIRWLVLVVVVYAAMTLLRAGLRHSTGGETVHGLA